MTVVVLDPRSPELIPLAARSALTGTVLVTEDVPASVLWELDGVEPVCVEPVCVGPVCVEPVAADSDDALTLLTTDPRHPAVLTRIANGDRVVEVPRQSGRELLDAVALMDTLRRNGPWESTQTHSSLRRYLLEEVYELLDAIDGDDQENLREELGDLLLQVLFHARIAADDPVTPFDIDDVARSFTEKVRGRTPGVLSGEHADLETQIREWEERKAAEKKRGSVLDGIATTAPALAMTQKVLERLTAAHYPTETIDPAVLTVTVEVNDDSVEASARERTLRLMEQVRAAEARAKSNGVVLDSREAWESVLA